MCRDLHIVEARPELYLEVHARLVQILNHHFATVKTLSVDEMACRVPSLCRNRDDEARLAENVKAHICRELGPHLRCSVGIAPNVFLAKVASDRKKPDGLTVWDESNLPDALFDCKLSDLPGIGSAMKRRLAEVGIDSVERLYDSSPMDLRRVWNSVVGERWYYMLRGSQEADYQPALSNPVKKSVGHSNVLAPEHRSHDGVKCILLELFAKALKRLRAYDQAASAVQVTVRYRRQRGSEGVWTRRSTKHLHANDERTWLRVVRPMLNAIPDLSPTAEPSQVGIVFSGLLMRRDMTLSLFDDDQEQSRLAQVVDALTRKHKGAVGMASLVGQEKHVPTRIAFGAPDVLA